MTRTGPASLVVVTGAGIVSDEGPIATESSLVIVAGFGGEASVVVVGLLCDNEESRAVADGASAAFDCGFEAIVEAFSGLVVVEEGGNEVSMGEEDGIATSFRRLLCDSVPAVLLGTPDASRSLISTALSEDLRCEVDVGLEVEFESEPWADDCVVPS